MHIFNDIGFIEKIAPVLIQELTTALTMIRFCVPAVQLVFIRSACQPRYLMKKMLHIDLILQSMC